MQRELKGRRSKSKVRSNNKNAKWQRSAESFTKAAFLLLRSTLDSQALWQKKRKVERKGQEAFSIDLTAKEVRKSEEIELETVNLLKDDQCQTTKFDYMFQTSKYQAPIKASFDCDDKVRFYTGLPSM